MQYNPRAWFWIVAGDESRVYSSADNTYLETTAKRYIEFLAEGGFATKIASEQELAAVLRQGAPGHLPDWLAAIPAFIQPSAGEWSAEQLIAYAADLRWRKEVGGITVSGVPVATDDRSKQMLMGARVAADANSAFQTPWVGADGAIYPLDAAQIIALSNAVLAHVASCFAIFAEIKVGISAGTITTRAQVDAAFAAI